MAYHSLQKTPSNTAKQVMQIMIRYFFLPFLTYSQVKLWWERIIENADQQITHPLWDTVSSKLQHTYTSHSRADWSS